MNPPHLLVQQKSHRRGTLERKRKGERRGERVRSPMSKVKKIREGKGKKEEKKRKEGKGESGGHCVKRKGEKARTEAKFAISIMRKNYY